MDESNILIIDEVDLSKRKTEEIRKIEKKKRKVEKINTKERKGKIKKSKIREGKGDEEEKGIEKIKFYLPS